MNKIFAIAMLFLGSPSFAMDGEPVPTRFDARSNNRPNVLFISIDDLNDWVGVFGGHAQVKTPNIDSFAGNGSVIFQNAHCPGPVCGSSRSALLSGFLPSTTGIYGNAQNMRNSKKVQQHATLPEYFSKNGYRSISRGKIFHKHVDAGGEDQGHWSFDHWEAARGGVGVDKTKITSRNRNLINGRPGPETNHSKPRGTEFAWGPTKGPKEKTKDFQTAQWAAKQLTQKHEKPFFLAVGISRPHLPFYCPQEFFDLYDPSTFKAPAIKEDDLEDILIRNTKRPKHKASADYLWLKQNGLIDEAARAYAAATSYADACLGVIFDALDNSPYKDNTIVIIWGDHGWHLGEKLRYRKATGWHEATRVPLLVRLPNMIQGQECRRTVNLIDLYPTLVDLCGLPEKPSLDGRSLVPLLTEPSVAWNQPSLTVFGEGNSSIHGERFHYIRYKDGTEEFYDLASDPMEWDNLIRHLTVEQEIEKQRLAELIPERFAPPVEATDKKLNQTGRRLNESIKATRPLDRLK